MLPRVLLTLSSLVLLAWALPASNTMLEKQKMADFINAQGQWRAEVHPRFADMDHEDFKKLLGARHRHEKKDLNIKIQPKSHSNDDIPKEFDSRKQWTECADVIDTIADQSSCGSCWAVSSASVMSDRVCIGTKGKNKTPVSPTDIISCCWRCGYGCQGGWPDEAFNYWTDSGVVSGSGYNVDQGCKPYPFAPCEHHTDKTKYPACPKKIYDTPRCQKSCQKAFTDRKYTDDKSYGTQAVFYSQDVKGTQREIMSNGSVVFTFDVYADFELYKGGVYEHTTGDYLGGHAVRAVGWGEENGKPYWLIANSWNEDWGENGYFRMIRGKNNCGIENEVSAAVVDASKLPA